MNTDTHDSLVDLINDEMLSRGYTNIHRNVNYKQKRSGEIDLYVQHNKYIYLFEMKSNYSIKSYNKAIDQLHRAEKYYFRNNGKKRYRVFKFFVYDHKDPKIKWIQ